MIPLDISDVYYIHDYMIERYGGLPGPKEPGWIEFTTQKPFQVIFGVDPYPTIFLKAAAYMEGFSTTQYFNDGNKRTAYGCAAYFLDINGYTLRLSDGLLYNIAMATAKGRLEVADLARIIERHVQPNEFYRLI